MQFKLHISKQNLQIRVDAGTSFDTPEVPCGISMMEIQGIPENEIPVDIPRPAQLILLHFTVPKCNIESEYQCQSGDCELKGKKDCSGPCIPITLVNNNEIDCSDESDEKGKYAIYCLRVNNVSRHLDQSCFNAYLRPSYPRNSSRNMDFNVLYSNSLFANLEAACKCPK